jgi:hypothetical protein
VVRQAIAHASPPAAIFCYSRDRKGKHPRTLLAGYAGLFQADAFNVDRQLYEPDCETAAKKDPGAFGYNSLIHNDEVRFYRGPDRRRSEPSNFTNSPAISDN